jgi:hypothetical protein
MHNSGMKPHTGNQTPSLAALYNLGHIQASHLEQPVGFFFRKGNILINIPTSEPVG